MAAAQARQDPAANVFGWVKSYRVTDDREVIMTCHDPGGGPDIEVRVLPIELDSMLRSATEPRKPAPRRRSP
jgi:hypothetical protein